MVAPVWVRFFRKPTLNHLIRGLLTLIFPHVVVGYVVPLVLGATDKDRLKNMKQVASCCSSQPRGRTTSHASSSCASLPHRSQKKTVEDRVESYYRLRFPMPFDP